MNYRNLKLHTAINLFSIIVFATIVINCVVAVFWYEHLVKQHLQSIKTHLQLELSKIDVTTAFSNDSNKAKTGKILGINEYHISTIIIDDLIISFVVGHPPIVENLSSSQTSDTILSYFNETNNFYSPFFSQYRHIIFENNARNSSITIPVGVEINVSFLARQIWLKEKFILLYILFNAAILTTIIFFRFRKTIFLPMDNLLNTANNYKLHDGLWSFHSTNNGEFDQLSLAMNAMVHRIEKDRDTLVNHVKQLERANIKLRQAQQESVQAEKLAATGRLAAGFAHEIGNPVTIIQGYLELLKQNNYSEIEKTDFIDRSISELKRIDNLLFQLMDLAKFKYQDATQISPKSILENVILTLQTTFSKNNITTIMSEVEEKLLITVDPELLRQVLLNILLNAIDAIVEKDVCDGGVITCTITSSLRDNSKFVVIKITDNGVGLEDQTKDKIFDPFFTTKPTGKGTGLGLSVVHRIIEALDGTIEVASIPQQKTTFTIFIPQSMKDSLND